MWSVNFNSCEIVLSISCLQAFREHSQKTTWSWNFSTRIGRTSCQDETADGRVDVRSTSLSWPNRHGCCPAKAYSWRFLQRPSAKRGLPIPKLGVRSYSVHQRMMLLASDRFVSAEVGSVPH